jgi:uncharacterized protein (TIGR03435 family)
MKPQIRLILAALIPCAAFSQTAAPQPTFEMADVHLSPKTLHPAKQGGALRAGRYELIRATMVDLIAAAYGVTPNKVLGGPNWLETDRFDVIARAPQNTSPQALSLMLQALLVERFRLAAHPDQKAMPAFALTIGNGGPKLKASEGSGSPGCQRQPQAAEAGTIPAICRGITMETFASLLSGAAGDYISSPVVNNTQLEGAWDFTLKWTPRSSLVAAGPDGISIFDAIDKQLGLKLELRQIPTAVLVVERVNESPLENPPGVAAALPPSPPPQFEAATIKPTDPTFTGTRLQFTPTVNISGVTLSYLLQNIWFITPEMISGAPKWLDVDRWDIVAKVAATAGAAPATDLDSMIVMVRHLIEDRFLLKTHLEERVIPAWTLTALKPKLRKADPGNRTGCKEGPDTDGKDLRLTNPGISRLVTCHNMTMAQLAEQLPGIANAQAALCCLYLRSPVLDSTGIDGAFDFTFGFSLPSAVQNKSDPGNGLPEPNGAVSLFEALNSQLGLRLALEKRAAPVLVIDHIEQKPVEN